MSSSSASVSDLSRTFNQLLTVQHNLNSQLSSTAHSFNHQNQVQTSQQSIVNSLVEEERRVLCETIQDLMIENLHLKKELNLSKQNQILQSSASIVNNRTSASSPSEFESASASTIESNSLNRVNHIEPNSNSYSNSNSSIKTPTQPPASTSASASESAASIIELNANANANAQKPIVTATTSSSTPIKSKIETHLHSDSNSEVEDSSSDESMIPTMSVHRDESEDDQSQFASNVTSPVDKSKTTQLSQSSQLRSNPSTLPQQSTSSSTLASSSTSSLSTSHFPLILGTSSKFRHKLMRELNLPFTIRTADIDERSITVNDENGAPTSIESRSHSDPAKLTLAIAKAKADEILRQLDVEFANQSKSKSTENVPLSSSSSSSSSTSYRPVSLLITADQVAHFNGEIREKPETKDECRHWFIQYTKQPIDATTGIVVTNTQTRRQFTSSVHIRQFYSPEAVTVIDSLIEQGDIMSCCGGFIIDSPIVAPFLSQNQSIGDKSSKMGFPLETLKTLLKQAQDDANAVSHKQTQ